MENLLSDLKVNCYDKVLKKLEDAEKIKNDLENNCEFLQQRINKTKEDLNIYKNEIDEIKNDSDKIRRLKDRIKSESFYINTEIPMIKKIVFKVIYLSNKIWNYLGESRYH